MERNTITEVKNLSIGDRFYKQNDRKKVVREIVPGDAKVTEYQTYTVFAKKQEALHPDAMKSNTMVVFLRHAERQE